MTLHCRSADMKAANRRNHRHPETLSPSCFYPGTSRTHCLSVARLFYFFGFIFLLALRRKIPALQRRTCSFHYPEKLLTLSLGLGSLVKDAISTELLSLDRSKIEGMFKEIQSIRSKVPSKE